MPGSERPRKSRPIWKRREFWVRRALPVAAGLFLIGVLGVVGLFAWYSRDLPDPNGIVDRSVAQSTKIYARDGETLLYEVHGEERRTVVELEKIPFNLQKATIAIEDKDFYKHGGIDFRGLFRAVFTNIINLDVTGQGGSTITQQFVKNAILTTEKSYVRKIKEAVLAYQIEKRFTKDQILKLYFNEIPYGRNAYGAEAAAQVYFGKSVSEVSLDEAALLAALPQAPSYYSPDGNHVDLLEGRQGRVLQNMADQGYITQEEADAAKEEDTVAKIIPRREVIKAPHFVIYVKELLTEKYGEKQIEQGGLRVITTLEPNLQQMAEDAVSNGMAKVERYGGSNAALVSLNPQTGQILAMVGSRDYFDAEHDGNVNVALRPRQPGSSFKPIVYAQAFREGYTPETILFDLITNFGGTPNYIPQNYNGRENGPVTMRKALAGSLNVPAVKTLYLVGVNDAVNLAKSLGYTTLNDPDRYGLSLTLGGGEVKLLEHTAAFGVFANEGVRQSTVAILRVEDRNGKILEETNEGEGERVLDQNVAREISSVLSDNGARAYIFGTQNSLILSGRPVAAKTGTTNDFRDAWTMGYTPNLVTGVWTGNNDNSEMSTGADGSVIAAPIWKSFMQAATAGAPVVNFTAPKPNDAEKPILQGRLSSGETLTVDTITGKEIPSECVDEWPEEFKKQKELEQVHTILYFVNKDNPRGPVPDNPASDPQFTRWEEPVRRWAEENDKLVDRPAKEDCDLRTIANTPKVTITSPASGSTITGNSVSVSATVDATRAITLTKFVIDGVEITEDTTAPFQASLDVSDLENGYHKLKVIAYDTVEQAGSQTIDVIIQHESSGTSIYFTAPVPGSRHAISDGAISISVVAQSAIGIDSVKVNITDANGVVTKLSTSSASGSRYSTQWTPLLAGDYTIQAIMTDDDGETTSTDNLSVSITAD
ncbi:MAG: PBP1A family penicillin-binding protein [Candidatus Nomurabacteria bacterium]|nr:MAG: PBP1A family penicillin-binding protein [Candidatus Nomurabacteria bacterium]